VLLAVETLLTGRELLRPGWIEISNGMVAAVGAGAAPRPPDRDLGAVTVVPGFVDTHVHGGGGANFSTASAVDTSTAVALHRRHGTTTLVASLVTASRDELLREVTGLADDVHAGLLAGIHLEGPWLSTKRCGAHQPSLMRDPDPTEVDRVLDAAGGPIRMVTLAPERDGAVAAIERFVDREWWQRSATPRPRMRRRGWRSRRGRRSAPTCSTRCARSTLASLVR
jgi:N-acetylglucosamine-6-phosphate deacetylase